MECGAWTRFVSNFTLRLDSQGASSRFAGFADRDLVPRPRSASTGSIAIRRSAGLRVDAGGNALMAEIEALIGRFAPFSDEREQFSLGAATAPSETLKIDGEGRVVLSETAEDATPGSPTRWHSSVSATSFRSGSPAAFAQSSRRPPERCARSKAAARFPGGGAQRARSTGMMAGATAGCRWRTGPSRSRARPPRARTPQCPRRRRLYRRHLRRRRLQRARSSPPPTARSSPSTATRARSRRGGSCASRRTAG